MESGEWSRHEWIMEDDEYNSPPTIRQLVMLGKAMDRASDDSIEWFFKNYFPDIEYWLAFRGRTESLINIFRSLGLMEEY